MSDYEIAIIAFSFKNGAIHVNEAASITATTWNSSKKDLGRLVKKGLLQFIASRFQRDPKSHYVIIEDRAPEDFKGRKHKI